MNIPQKWPPENVPRRNLFAIVTINMHFARIIRIKTNCHNQSNSNKIKWNCIFSWSSVFVARPAQIMHFLVILFGMCVVYSFFFGMWVNRKYMHMKYLFQISFSLCCSILSFLFCSLFFLFFTLPPTPLITFFRLLTISVFSYFRPIHIDGENQQILLVSTNTAPQITVKGIMFCMFFRLISLTIFFFVCVSVRVSCFGSSFRVHYHFICQLGSSGTQSESYINAIHIEQHTMHITHILYG